MHISQGILMTAPQCPGLRPMGRIVLQLAA